MKNTHGKFFAVDFVSGRDMDRPGCAECAALKEELEHYRGIAEKWGAEKAVSDRDKAVERANKAENDNARLREALEGQRNNLMSLATDLGVDPDRWTKEIDAALHSTTPHKTFRDGLLRAAEINDVLIHYWKEQGDRRAVGQMNAASVAIRREAEVL
jgi:hypothetical protein